MTTLRELDAKFVKVTENGFDPIETLEGADGVTFECPKCGGHTVWIPFPHLPESQYSKARWKPSGTGLDDLTFVPYEGHPNVSVRHLNGCMGHYFVKNGQIEFC